MGSATIGAANNVDWLVGRKAVVKGDFWMVVGQAFEEWLGPLREGREVGKKRRKWGGIRRVGSGSAVGWDRDS